MFCWILKISFFRYVLLILFLSLVGCAHSIHEYQVSDYDPAFAASKSRVVEAKAEQFVIMGITGNTDYVQQAWHDLQNQCRGSVLTGINTRFSTSLGFFSWTNKIYMKGYCLTKI